MVNWVEKFETYAIISGISHFFFDIVHLHIPLFWPDIPGFVLGILYDLYWITLPIMLMFIIAWVIAGLGNIEKEGV